jgi:hypothetical protein
MVLNATEKIVVLNVNRKQVARDGNNIGWWKIHMSEKWVSVTVECWNYRKHFVGQTRTVEIGDDRFCHSDCEADTCPLNKKKTSVNQIKKEEKK